MLKTCLFFLFILSNLWSQTTYTFKTLTVEEGLAQNSVTSIAQDSNGFLWFATQDGLSLFNGLSFQRKNYIFDDITRKDYYRIGKVYFDTHENLWISPINQSLVKESNGKKTLFSEIQNPSAFFEINSTLWVGTYGKGLYSIRNNKVVKVSNFDDSLQIYSIAKLNDNQLLIATNKGLQRLSLKTQQVKRISEEGNYSCLIPYGKSLIAATFNGSIYKVSETHSQRFDFSTFEGADFKNKTIYDLEIDSHGKLWVATFDEGIFLIDFSTKTIQHLSQQKNNPRTLNYNYILDLFKDQNGTIWVGTDGGGVNYYDEKLNKFNTLTNEDLNSDSSVDLPISLSIDSENTLWIGTSGKGLTKYNTSTREAKTFPIIGKKRLLSLLHDDEGNFWIGALQSGLYVFDEQMGVTKIEVKKSHNLNQLLSVAWIKDVGKDLLLFGTYNHGVFLYHRVKGVLKNFYTGNNPHFQTDLVTCALAIHSNEFLLGMGNGDVLKLNINDNTTKTVLSNESLGSAKIKSLYKQNNTLFVGTINGLFKISGKTIHKYNTEDGLPNNVIYSIAPDKKNNLWISTNQGVAKLSGLYTNNLEVKSFTKEDGLQGNEFNTGAYFQKEDGTIFFGGINGINWFHPEDVQENQTIPTTKITGFFLTKDKSNAPCNLKHNQNNLSIAFTASVITLAKKNQYKYRLLGIDNEWKSLGNKNSIDFFELPSGKYEFQVLGSHYDGVWSKEPATLQFKIRPTWQHTTLAYVGYGILAITVFLIIFSLQRKRLQTLHQINSLEFINQTKSKLYAEISHELKTPLTLIQANTKLLKSQQNYSQKSLGLLNSTEQNTNQILTLVNQMLDLVSIDANKLKLEKKNFNIIAVLDQSIQWFESKAKFKDQHLIFMPHTPEYRMQLDPKNLQIILNNLLSNAIKFTPKGGEISLKTWATGQSFFFGLSDTGQGISREHLPHIFDRHYRTFDLDNNLGNGIGMALCKELVQLMNGKIQVKSQLGQGTTFTIELPVDTRGKKMIYIPEGSVNEEDIGTEHALIQKTTSVGHHLVIVEDNPEMQNYYQQLLGKDYTITPFNNGTEALKALPNLSCDFILSDILMPKLNGFELCQALKKDWKISHIPFIVVSGKDSINDKKHGYKIGVDAFLSKPFEEEELKLIIKNLLSKKKEAAEYYKKLNEIQPSDLQHSYSPNELDFIQKFQELALNPELNSSTETFAQNLGMSRTQLHRKTKALVGMSTTEYLNHVRIEKAKQLLISTKLSIKEIAFEVGYSDAGYFGKIFKNTTQNTPRSYRDNPE